MAPCQVFFYFFTFLIFFFFFTFYHIFYHTFYHKFLPHNPDFVIIPTPLGYDLPSHSASTIIFIQQTNFHSRSHPVHRRDTASQRAAPLRRPDRPIRWGQGSTCWGGWEAAITVACHFLGNTVVPLPTISLNIIPHISVHHFIHNHQLDLTSLACVVKPSNPLPSWEGSVCHGQQCPRQHADGGSRDGRTH